MHHKPPLSHANPPCPFLPRFAVRVRVADLKLLGDRRDDEYYEKALGLAQTFWQDGLPAQALLQLNRAFACELEGEHDVLTRWPLPYTAMAWILFQRPEGQFLGNPRAHFQHLATRMNEPRKQLRTWRAWACWWLTCQLLPIEEFPPDEKQLAEESIVLPDEEEIAARLNELGLPGETSWWKDALHVSLIVG